MLTIFDFSKLKKLFFSAVVLMQLGILDVYATDATILCEARLFATSNPSDFQTTLYGMEKVSKKLARDLKKIKSSGGKNILYLALLRNQFDLVDLLVHHVGAVFFHETVRTMTLPERISIILDAVDPRFSETRQHQGSFSRLYPLHFLNTGHPSHGSFVLLAHEKTARDRIEKGACEIELEFENGSKTNLTVVEPVTGLNPLYLLDIPSGIDNFGNSAKSVVEMLRTFLEERYTSVGFRRYLATENFKKLPLTPGVFRRMVKFPYDNSLDVKYLLKVRLQKWPDAMHGAFFQQKYDVSNRGTVNALWREFFDVADNFEGLRPQGYGAAGVGRGGAYAKEAPSVLPDAVRCLKALDPNNFDEKDKELYDLDLAAVNVLTGHSSFGFDPRLATDDEATVMVNRLMNLGRSNASRFQAKQKTTMAALEAPFKALETKLEKQIQAKKITEVDARKEFFDFLAPHFVAALKPFIEQFKTDPVDTLTRPERQVLLNHQRTCAEIAGWTLLGNEDEMIYDILDKTVRSVFGSANSKMTLKKRSEGGAIPDSCFSLSGILIERHSHDDDKW
jgi:hypothetical protein